MVPIPPTNLPLTLNLETNSEFLGLLQSSLSIFEKEIKKIDNKSLRLNANIIVELGETWEHPDEFSELGKNYIDRYSSYKRNISEQKSVMYYQGLIKNFQNFESIFSFYDDIKKYPDTKIHKEIETKVQTALDGISKIFASRDNFSTPQIKLDKPPATEEVVPEFTEEGYVERLPVKVLSLITLEELKFVGKYFLVSGEKLFIRGSQAGGYNRAENLPADGRGAR
jgi:hypothetical protein